MNLQQAKIILEKINALQKSMQLDNGEVSKIERDLMLSYTRQLYETYLHLDQADKKFAPIPKPAPAPAPAPTPKPKVVAPPPPAPAPPPPVVQAPAPPPVVQAPPPPAPVKETPPPPPVQEVKASASVEALFRQKAAKELSEKLSQQKIGDLTKALSINDKLLYANELFGRDMLKMNNVLAELNKLAGMKEARKALIGFAEEFNWTEEERTEVAQSFIKLVSRKYT